jgi:hypothetical protein
MMTMMRSAMLQSAALSLLAAPTAQAATPACITPLEMRTGIAFIVPTMLKGLRTKCAGALPRDAYLTQKGEALGDRFKTTAFVNDAALQSLIAKILPDAELPEAARTSAAMMFSETMAAQIQKDIKPDTCPTIDKTLALLDPLPAANVIGIFQVIGTQMIQSDLHKRKAKGKSSEYLLCDTGQ